MFFIRVSLVARDFFFPFYHCVLFLWKRKSDAVAQLVAFYLSTDLSPHFVLEVIRKPHNKNLSFCLVSMEKLQEKCNSYHSGMTMLSCLSP